MKNLSLYVDNGSFLTKLHSFTKLCYIFTAIFVSFMYGSYYGFCFFIGVSLLLLCSGRVLKNALPLLVFSFSILIVIFLIHGLFHNGNITPLFSIGPMQFYTEGSLYALKISLNILNILLAFALFILTTKPSIFVEDLERIGVSPKIGYMVNSVFQIVPQMSNTMNTIIDAQRSRGLETEGNLFVRAKSFIPLISPVVMSSLINTRERAIALEMRGFDSKHKKTYLTDHPMKKNDYLICLVFLLMMLASIFYRISAIL